MFKQTARLWSHVYAGAPVSSPEYTRKIDKLCAMGFEKVSTSQLLFLLHKTEQCLNSPPSPRPPSSFQNAVIVALSSKSWDVETATELLLSNWISTSSSSPAPVSRHYTFTPLFPPNSRRLEMSLPLRRPPPFHGGALASTLPFFSLAHPTLHPSCGLSCLLITSAVPHSNQSLCKLSSLGSF